MKKMYVGTIELEEEIIDFMFETYEELLAEFENHKGEIISAVFKIKEFPEELFDF